MKAFREKYLRPCRSWTDILLIAGVLSFVITILGTLFSIPIALVTQMARITKAVTGNEDVANFMMLYFDTIGAWAAGLLIMWGFKRNRPMLKAVRYDGRGNSVKAGLIGLLAGFGMNGLCILISVLKGDIKLTFGSFDLVNLLLFLLFVFIQSGSEELLMRVYLYQKLRRRYRHPAVAIIGNAVIFSAMHAFNPGYNFGAAMQILLVGMLFALFVYYFGSFWAAATAHTAWNFTQSILFGLPNSGIVSAYSLFRLDAASARNGFFYNVGFGVEGSPGSSIVLAAACVVVIILGRKKKKGEYLDLWKDAEAAAIAENAAKQTPAAAQEKA